ncbi:MAG TPA: heme biosynthesis HemY N-terminal domain-containing protein [Wenzhouxiangella sp.]
MKWGLVFLVLAAVLIAGALIAPVLLEDPGLVVIGVGAWEIEMPLIAWVLAVVVAWMVLSLVLGVIRWPGRLLAKRKQARSRQQLEEGFLALTEGEWDKAERLFAQSLTHQKSTAGLLGAARAAQGRSDPEARDAWLDQANARFGRKHFITQFARARLALEEGRVDQAITILETLHLKKPKHMGVLRSLLGAYQDSGRWQQLRELTPALRRAGMLDAKKAQALSQLAAERELTHCDDYQSLQQTWKSLGSRERKERPLVLAYAHRAGALGHHDHAGRLLGDLLDQGLDGEVLSSYRISDETNRARRILDCEKRIQHHPEHPELLETLGLLYLDDRQYEKAQSFLEQALKTKASVEIYMALGRLMDRQGDAEASARYYRNALQFQAKKDQRLLDKPGFD